MKTLFKQFSGLFGAGIAAACCMGVSAVLIAVGAVGLGFLVHDAYLFPIFVGFVGFSLWQLFYSARQHENMTPFWFSFIGGLIGSIGLWLLVTGFFPMSWPMIIGLGMLVVGSLWDFANGRKSKVCAATENAPKNIDSTRRAVNGAALAVASGVVFYGLYKSVDIFSPAANANEIACYGINSCKGTTDCSSAFNSCNGQNDCKGKGWLNTTASDCSLKGGVPLKGSPADPEQG